MILKYTYNIYHILLLFFLFLKKKGVEKNETKAFYYFLAGADMHSSSDALFNTGYCLQNGMKIT